VDVWGRDRCGIIDRFSHCKLSVNQSGDSESCEIVANGMNPDSYRDE
jgi:hypothetical protein